MDDFDVPRTPKRRHSTSSKRTGIHIDDKNIVFANPFRTPRKMELVRRDYPRAEAETCPPCHPSCEPELVHSLSTSELAQSHSQATRSAGILPRLRNKYQVSASTEALSSTTTAEATELPSISDALPPTASIASHSAPASTFLKSTFLKMFSKNTSDGSTITESRSTSRHGVRRSALPEPRSNSRLDNRINKLDHVFLDNPDRRDHVLSSDKTLSDPTKEPFLRTTKSITNLFRARTPTPTPASTPSPAFDNNSFIFDKQNFVSEEYPDSAIAEDAIVAPEICEAQAIPVTEARQPIEVKYRLRRAVGSVSSASVRGLQPLNNTSTDSVQALTADTLVEPAHTHIKPMNFSRPARVQQTAAREAMEMESWTARFTELEEIMSVFQEKMLELEQIMLSQRAHTGLRLGPADCSSMIKHSQVVEPTPPPSHLDHTSNDDLSASWLREDSSEAESMPATPDLTVSDSFSTIKPSTKSDMQINPIRPISAEPEELYLPTAKVYKMFVESQDDIESLQQALNALRADAPPGMRLPSTPSLQPKDTAEDEDPFIQSVKAQSPSSSCAFTSYASSHHHSASQDRRSSAHSNKYNSYLDSQSDSSDAESSVRNSPKARKRSLAVVGTARKAMQVLGAQQVDIDAHPPRTSSRANGSKRRMS